MPTPTVAHPRPGRGDRGQVLPLVALTVLLAVFALTVLVNLGVRVDDAGRARTAADAAALAGAAGGETEARALATANGGELIEFRQSGARVHVVVRVGSVSRTASAEAVVEWTRPPGGG